MFRKIIFYLFVFMFLLPCPAQAEEVIVQGPYNINKESSIYIKKEKDENFPLGLYLEKNGVSKKIDEYETNGAIPNVDTVFFMNLDGLKNLIILISWHQVHRAENISGTSYQIYGYTFHDGDLNSNKVITNDPELSGEEGEFYGEEMHFKYKNAELIKGYLYEKYKVR